MNFKSLLGVLCTCSVLGVANGQTPHFRFGIAHPTTLDTSTDFNGDGVPDIIVGQGKNGLMTSPVEVRSGLNGTLLGSLNPPAGATHSFGTSVATIADYTGDGRRDILVGDPGAGPNLQGQVHVYSGAPVGVPPTFPLKLTWNPLTIPAPAPGTSEEYGWAICDLGDFNGDGIQDIAVSADKYEGPVGSVRGALEVLSLAPLAAPVASAWFPNPQLGALGTNELLGFSLANVGDINLDGLPDFVAGGSGGLGAGRVEVFTSTVPVTRLTILSPAGAGGAFGYAVAGVGDATGDGVPDFAVGAPDLASGGLFVYSGGAVAIPPMTILGGPLAKLGYSVARIGDYNGDGLNDVLASAVAGSGTWTSNAYVDVYSGVTGAVLFHVDQPAAASPSFGSAVAGIRVAVGPQLIVVADPWGGKVYVY